jgi:pilus assembly protein Flp/PilA
MACHLLLGGQAQPPLGNQIHGEKTKMKDAMLKLYIKIQNLLSQDEGQDLVEYALVVALVALGATAALGSLGSKLSSIFGSITSALVT